MIESNLLDVLARLGGAADRLRRVLRFDWTSQTEQAVWAARFLLELQSRLGGGRASGIAGELSLVGIVGGASSGKSTIFNNLLGGRAVSRVTARGHATRGLIAAVHERHRDRVEAMLASGLLFPAFARCTSLLDDDIAGQPDALHVVYHSVDALRDVALFDTPDFTSEPARVEGDIALTTLPWYDRLIVIIDHERWFDRQAIGHLRDESARFGQRRFVVFNRGQAGPMAEDQQERLAQQAGRLAADGFQMIEFRQGRGRCTFPPNTLAPLLQRLAEPILSRRAPLLRFLGRAATSVLNNNGERRSRLAGLSVALERAALSAVPSRTDCIASLMTSDEKRHLDVIARTLRVRETREWLARQADRIRQALRRRVPLIGGMLPASASVAGPAADAPDRATVGWEVFCARCRRQLAAIDEAVSGSDFWSEIRRWTSIEPPPSRKELNEQCRDRINALMTRLDAAIKTWTAKVESECRGVAPHLLGAVGATALAGAIVLIAVAGPVTALTWPVISVALGKAVATLLASAGAGAVAGRPLTRLLVVIQEKLLGSDEFLAVGEAVEEYRQAIAQFGRAAAAGCFAHAQALVLPDDDELTRALTVLCDAVEAD
ncbi:MAG TPA: hypothetical protein VMV94_15440 [Phycisphaerae bacterium]|nr:hypothetical protein [Phycisphaerae bacterium]